MEITGKLILKTFSPGSKSEHEAVYIVTSNGEYVLRRVGANPFNDPDLKAMAGKEVTASGEIIGYLFLADEVESLV